MNIEQQIGKARFEIGKRVALKVEDALYDFETYCIFDRHENGFKRGMMISNATARYYARSSAIQQSSYPSEYSKKQIEAAENYIKEDK